MYFDLLLTIRYKKILSHYIPFSTTNKTWLFVPYAGYGLGCVRWNDRWP